MLNRRDFLGSAAALPAVAQGARSKNVVLLIADDLGLPTGTCGDPNANGQSGHAHGEHNLHYLPKFKPAPELLRRAGYGTGVIAKLHVNPLLPIPLGPRRHQRRRTRCYARGGSCAGFHQSESGQTVLLARGLHRYDRADPAKDMIAKLKQASLRANLFTAEGAAHGFFNRPPWYQPTLARMAGFFAITLR